MGRELLPLPLVLVRVVGARGGALDRLGLEHAVLGDQRVPLRRRAQQPAAGARQVVLQEAGVRRRVELAQPQVGLDRAERARLLEPVGQVDLVGVAGEQVVLHSAERVGVRPWRERRGSRRRALPRPSAGPRRLVVEQPHVPGPHPDRVGHRRAHRRGQVGAGGVAEVAEPLVRLRPAGELVLEHREHVGADLDRAPDGVPGHHAEPRVVRQRHVGLVEPADDRATPGPLAGAAAVQPEAPAVPVGDVGEERGRVVALAHARPASSRPARGRARRGSTRGGTARPRAAASGAGPPSPPSPRWRSPPARRVRRPPRASGSAPPRTPAARPRRRRARRASPPPPRRARAAPARPCRRTRAPGPACRGTRPAPGPCPALSTSRPTEKSASSAGCPGPGESSTCECASTAAASTSSCCTTVGSSPVTAATRWTRFQV